MSLGKAIFFKKNPASSQHCNVSSRCPSSLYPYFQNLLCCDILVKIATNQACTHVNKKIQVFLVPHTFAWSVETILLHRGIFSLFNWQLPNGHNIITMCGCFKWSVLSDVTMNQIKSRVLCFGTKWSDVPRVPALTCICPIAEHPDYCNLEHGFPPLICACAEVLICIYIF